MTPLLTEAERGMMLRLKKYYEDLVSEAEVSPFVKDSLECYEVLTRLLSARAVPVETVAWRDRTHPELGPAFVSDAEKSMDENGSESQKIYASGFTEPLILRSAAEADKAGVVAENEYDRAVAALAPYLPDGWVAQDANGDTVWCSKNPSDRFDQWAHNDAEWLDLKMKIPKVETNKTELDAWRTSLRRIVSGKIVPAAEGVDPAATKEGEG